MRIAASTLTAIVTLSFAHAAPRLAADKHKPRVALDPSSVWLRLVSHSENGYSAQAGFVIMGATSKSDRLQLEWKQGGKVVAVSKCNSNYKQEFTSLYGSCTLDKDIKAKGPVDIDIVYSDDQAETDYLVTTLKIDVRRWKSIGTSIEWGFVPDDLLAVAFVSHDREFSRPYIQFWSTAPLSGYDAQFRCTVNGKKLPDFDPHIDNSTNTDGATIEHVWVTPKDRKAYTFTHFSLNPGFVWGTKAEWATSVLDHYPKAIDHPGKWDCALRIDGKAVRRFLFTIDEKGHFVPSAMQSGKWPLATFDDMVMIDMRIPDNNGVEKRIRNEALKKSIGFGLPWPEHPSVKEAQAALPKSMGTPD